MTAVGVPIGFSRAEVAKMWCLATSRQGVKERYGVTTKKVDGQLSNRDLHYLGLKGEHAVAKLMGTQVNRVNTPHGDGGVDFIYRGLTVDVKYSQLDIKLFLDDSPKADILILVQPLTRPLRRGPYVAQAEKDPYIKKPVFAWKNTVVVGWITQEDFTHGHEIKRIGSFDRKLFRAHNTRDMEAIMSYALSRGPSK